MENILTCGLSFGFLVADLITTGCAILAERHIVLATLALRSVADVSVEVSVEVCVEVSVEAVDIATFTPILVTPLLSAMNLTKGCLIGLLSFRGIPNTTMCIRSPFGNNCSQQTTANCEIYFLMC